MIFLSSVKMQKSLMMSSTILPVVDHWLLLLLKYGFYVSVQVLFAVWFIRRLIRKQTLESPARWEAMIFVIQVVLLFLFLVIPSLLALCGRFFVPKETWQEANFLSYLFPILFLVSCFFTYFFLFRRFFGLMKMPAFRRALQLEALNISVAFLLIVLESFFAVPLFFMNKVFDKDGDIQDFSAAMVRPQSVYQDGDVVVTAIPQKVSQESSPTGTCSYAIRRIYGVPNERVALEGSKKSSQDIINDTPDDLDASVTVMVPQELTLASNQYYVLPLDGKQLNGNHFFESVVASSMIVGKLDYVMKPTVSSVAHFIADLFHGVSPAPPAVSMCNEAQFSLRMKELSPEMLRYVRLSRKSSPSVTPYTPSGTTKGWEEYQNDALGIRFRYPKEWGTPTLSPIEFITNLEKAAHWTESEENGYYRSLEISFSQIRTPDLKFFTDEYRGEPSPYASTRAEKSLVDTVEAVKMSGDICRYTNNLLDTESGRYIIETDSECHPTMKVLLKESNGERVTAEPKFENGSMVAPMTPILDYQLSFNSYRHLPLSTFPHLLVTEGFPTIDRAASEPIETVAEYIATGTVPSYEDEKSRFALFVDSITTFDSVIKKPTIELSESLKGDDGARLLVRYYQDIQSGDLQSAYRLKKDAGSFERFSELYKDTFKAIPRDIRRHDDGSYEFFVDYQDDNRAPTVYHVIMTIDGGLLSTTFVEEIVEQTDVNSRMKGLIVARGDTRSVLVQQDGRERILESSTSDPNQVGSGLSFSHVSFHNKNRFVVYGGFGWEWSFGSVYDLKKDKKVLSLSDPNIYDFTPDETHFYACSLNEMGGDLYAKAYSVPDFDTVFDASITIPEFRSSDVRMRDLLCSYESGTNSLVIQTSFINAADENRVSWGESSDSYMKKSTWKYSFRTHRVSEVK